MHGLVRTVVWRRLDQAGAEYCSLWSDGKGWELRGTVVAALDGRPVKITYGVICDSFWQTRAVHVGLRSGGPEQTLHLTVDQQQGWWIGEEEQGLLRSCADVDLAFTPSTNTLPIRRLDLGIRGSSEVLTASLRLPELTLEPVPQRYWRMDQRRYRIESGSQRSSTDLEVDELGLITRYHGGWERTAAV